jgi:hypothetical protein
MFAPNPYDAVDIDAFRANSVGVIRGREIYHIVLTGHKGFPACVFRDHLVRALFNFTKDEWHLGNDDLFIQLPLDDLCLAVSPRDAATLKAYGWL